VRAAPLLTPLRVSHLAHIVGTVKTTAQTGSPQSSVFVMSTKSTKMWTDAHSIHMPCPPGGRSRCPLGYGYYRFDSLLPARANIRACQLRNDTPFGHLTQKHAWGSQDNVLLCPVEQIHLDAVFMLSYGRNGTGPAWAPVTRFLPDFACSQIHTLHSS
jgi:hypothetical protein